MGVSGRPTRASAVETNPLLTEAFPFQSSPPANAATAAARKVTRRNEIIIFLLLRVCRVEARRTPPSSGPAIAECILAEERFSCERGTRERAHGSPLIASCRARRHPAPTLV